MGGRGAVLGHLNKSSQPEHSSLRPRHASLHAARMCRAAFCSTVTRRKKDYSQHGAPRLCVV